MKKHNANSTQLSNARIVKATKQNVGKTAFSTSGMQSKNANQRYFEERLNNTEKE